MGKIPLSTPLEKIHGVGPRFLSKLKRLDIHSVRDLLFHFPTRYEDYSAFTKIADLVPHEECTVRAEVKKISARRAWTRRKMTVIDAILKDETGEIKSVWFNQSYIQNILTPEKRANFSGKVSVSKDGELYFSNPVYEIGGARDSETKHTGRIVPVYPETKGLTSKGLRYLIKPLLENSEPPEEFLPDEVLKNNNLLHRKDAIKKVHFPPAIEVGLDAKRRFAFEELFLLQLHFLKEKIRISKNHSRPITTEVNEIKQVLSTLPFVLTEGQKRSLWEIAKDINREHPMNRLLQGDVGSGKTIVAALSAIFASKNGLQTAFLAPTEILARQHYETIKRFFPEYADGIALITGSCSNVSYGQNLEGKITKQELLKKIKSGGVKIIIGTHALLAEKKSGERAVVFHSLGLVVVDEQHHFGVRQRAALSNDSKNLIVPHFLSMSATPIPRSLSLAFWGDLDISLIRDTPKNRRPVITRVVPPEKRAMAYTFIRKEIKSGRQAFVICPRIEPENNGAHINDKNLRQLEIKSVKEEYERLSKKIFPDLNVAMLHGKLKAEEKEKIMRGFSENKINILVSTSVVEVGVDIPNATIMMIEGSERFGLAQLYQFRGRVGRGEHQSYCLLFTDLNSKETKGRLLSIVEAKNGFELAEKDLKLRGPGQFLGYAQSGIPDISMNALLNPEIMKEARAAAAGLLEKDGKLENFSLLKSQLKKFTERLHEE